MKWGKGRRKKERKKWPLKWSMIGMLLVGWLLPFTMLTICLLYFTSSTIRGQLEKTIIVSTDKAVEICDMELRDIIKASKEVNYIDSFKKAYQEYKVSGNRYELSNNMTRILNQNYRYDERFLCTMVYFLDEPQYIYYSYNTYWENNSSITGYDRVRDFRVNAMDEVMAMSPKLDTSIRFVNVAGHLYLVRNIVNENFKPYAMFVMQLPPNIVFESLNSVWGETGYEIYLDGTPVFKNRAGRQFDEELIKEAKTGQAYYVNQGKSVHAYEVISKNGQRIAFVVSLDPNMIINSLSMARYVFYPALIFMLPLVIMVFRFFYRKVTKPVADLVGAAQEIGRGNYGHTLDKTSNSQEFAYLDTAFNAMSQELKHQFEKIYVEELALKDANIMALQSQINPHFLNNTLEIINWEARMNGNETVSGMIEALATMLNATMNRKQRRFVTLMEELTYVDAYLYIIKQRFGERFQVERDIDEALLSVKVPMLIIQPIVENAVEHGMSVTGKGTVSIHIFARYEEEITREIQKEYEESVKKAKEQFGRPYRTAPQLRLENRPEEKGKMYIEISNEGELSEEDSKKIAYLLGGNVQEDTERHVSLGIRNVDKRLKIIYGTECGLSIKSDNAGKTISTIIVKIDNESNISQ